MADIKSESVADFLRSMQAGRYSDARQSRSIARDRSQDQGTSIAWSTAELPYLTIWKNTAAAEDGYVTGLEPGTDYPFNRKVERSTGRLPSTKRSIASATSANAGSIEVSRVRC